VSFDYPEPKSKASRYLDLVPSAWRKSTTSRTNVGIGESGSKSATNVSCTAVGPKVPTQDAQLTSSHNNNVRLKTVEALKSVSSSRPPSSTSSLSKNSNALSKTVLLKAPQSDRTWRSHSTASRIPPASGSPAFGSFLTVSKPIASTAPPLVGKRTTSDFIKWKAGSSGDSDIHGAQYTLLEAVVVKASPNQSVQSRKGCFDEKEEVPGSRLSGVDNSSTQSTVDTSQSESAWGFISTTHTASFIHSINMGDSHRLVGHLKLMISSGLKFPPEFMAQLMEIAAGLASKEYSGQGQGKALESSMKMKDTGVKSVQQLVGGGLSVDEAEAEEDFQAMEAISNMLLMLTAAKESRPAIWQWYPSSAMVCSALHSVVKNLLMNNNKLQYHSEIADKSILNRGGARLKYCLQFLKFLIFHFDYSSLATKAVTKKRKMDSGTSFALSKLNQVHDVRNTGDFLSKCGQNMIEILKKDFVTLLVMGDRDARVDCWEGWCGLLTLVGELIRRMPSSLVQSSSQQKMTSLKNCSHSEIQVAKMMSTVLSGMKMADIKTPTSEIVRAVVATPHSTGTTIGKLIVTVVMLNHGL